MPIEFVFANAFGAEAFAHGCNCQGSTGAGIAWLSAGMLVVDESVSEESEEQAWIAYDPPSLAGYHQR